MYTHSASISGSRPNRQSAWTITYEQLSMVVVALDAAALIGAALLSHGLHEIAAHGRDVDAATFASAAAIPIGLLLPALYAEGCYRPDAILNPRFLTRRLVAIWAAALVFLLAVVYCLRIEETFDLDGFAIFAAVAPIGLLVQRRVVANVARAAIGAGQLRSPSVFVIADTAGHAPLDRPEGHRGTRHVMTIPSLAEVERPLLDQMLATIRASDAEEIHLVSTSARLRDCQLLLAELRKLPLPVKLVADATQAELLKHRVVEADGVFAFELQRAPLSPVERSLKRSFDILLALALCLLLSPVLIVVALLVYLTSEGPVLFRQTRNGFNGRPFTIYKFRTMTVQENGAVVLQAWRGDPRVTPLGRVLRRTSLDELPQLVNVLRGEMSLIGPRPHALAHDQEFAARIANYALRQHVKPGITGWAQVRGHRGETSTPEAIARRIELDLRYIERWSVWLDLWIVVQTVRALLLPKNAY